MDAFVAVVGLLGGPGLVLGALAGYFLGGPTPTRRAVVVFGGVALVVAFTLASILSTDPNTCHDCEEWHGGAYSVLTILFFIGNLLGWLLGALIGSVLAGRRTSGVTSG
jgi:hypothetical protein